MKKVYQELAALLQARKNCEDRMSSEQESNIGATREWVNKHSENINKIMKLAPSGSGIDSGIKLDDKSNSEKLVFYFGFHHMNENGMYDGWTEHTAIITPCFGGINIKITGRNRNDIKDYLYDVLDSWLSDNLIEDYDKETDTMHYNTESLKNAQDAYQAGIKNGTIN